MDNLEQYSLIEIEELKNKYLSSIELDPEKGYKDPKFKDVYFKIN